MKGLTISHISKQFKDAERAILNDIDLHVGSDEFLVLLGPSGCGKTTLLRIIAGLEEASGGEILLDGQVISDLEPQARGIGMVFQNYALYPHMTVGGNLSFGLKVAGIKRAQRREMVASTSQTLDISQHIGKKPHVLSGGERQRVAMGRAMVKECRAYLFDEPLSNLDDVLRSRLRVEILGLFHQMRVPFVYVTHDQVDAMTLGTKVAVMRDGIIQQLGAPLEVYERPATRFVAGFLGSPKMNFLLAEVVAGERISLRINGLPCPYADGEQLRPYAGRQIIVGIRPEDILTSPAQRNPAELTPLTAELRRYEHLGSHISLYLDFNGQTLCALAPANIRGRLGGEMKVYLDRMKLHLFDPETERRI